MTKVGLITTAAFMAAVVSACKKPVVVSNWAYIVGDSNDIVTIGDDPTQEIPAAHLNAAVVLTTNIDSSRRKFCSGTMIASDAAEDTYRIVTSRHCFAPSDNEDRESENQLLEGACESTKAFFGFYRHEIDQREIGKCRVGSLRTDLEGDLAVFHLEKNPSDKYQPSTFWSNGPTPLTGRRARIVHFPTVDREVDGNNDKVVYETEAGTFLPLGQLTTANCEISGTFDPIDWNLDTALAFGIKHTCDQKKGSSGSSLWDAETNTILGINWGGISITYNNPLRTETWNVATNADYVNLFLKAEHEPEKAKILSQKPDPGSYQSADSTQATKSNGVNKRLRIGCGTVSGTNADESSRFLTFCLLALPVLLLYGLGIVHEFKPVLRRQRRR